VLKMLDVPINKVVDEERIIVKGGRGQFLKKGANFNPSLSQAPTELGVNFSQVSTFLYVGRHAGPFYNPASEASFLNKFLRLQKSWRLRSVARRRQL
jgi:hypothetical protein